jgi:GNAT-family acetyltransferase (TIGR03103 family)
MSRYIRDPQVVIAQAPQDLFIDPTLTFRLPLLEALPERRELPGLTIRPLAGIDELRQVNRIYLGRGMVPVAESFLDDLDSRNDLVAWDESAGKVVGTVLGVDHRLAFGDPDNGSSLWALAADAQRAIPGLGTALVLALASRLQERGRSMMDLSVMHDNEEAIQLYRELGFEQVPVYCIKNRNAINEHLYTGPRSDVALNPYAQIITDEAYRRGISVEIEDEHEWLFRLSLGGRVVHCRESLTDATSGVAVARFDMETVLPAGMEIPVRRTANLHTGGTLHDVTYLLHPRVPRRVHG